jgi:hypothetical protein
MAEIAAEQAGNAADSSYIINWRTQRPGGVKRSGFCNVTPDGKVRKFHLDTPSARPSGAGVPPSGLLVGVP